MLPIYPSVGQSRRKALLKLPEGDSFEDSLKYHGTEGMLMEEGMGGYRHIKADMGQIISLQARTAYPDADWSQSPNNDLPEVNSNEVRGGIQLTRGRAFSSSGRQLDSCA